MNIAIYFFEQYGERAAVCSTLDKEYAKVKSVDGTWISFLNELRKKLCQCGFEKEVQEQDGLFVKKMEKALSTTSQYSGKTMREVRKNYVPMEERWKIEQWK